jgi:predicted homoserine dehydrogenase-like protein
MIYENLFAKTGKKQIKAGLIGSGAYGISLLMQSRFISRLEIPVVCDVDPKVAIAACLRAGIPEEKIVICDNRTKLLEVLESKKCAIADNYELVVDSPIDVLVECTGNSEAGARHAELAIQFGKHVAMVTKETDSVIGPILYKLAQKAGLVYTPVDGDQHGLLIGLVSWARSIGLDIICGGKARPYDFVYDEERGTISNGVETKVLLKEEERVLQEIRPGEAHPVLAKRQKMFGQWPQIAEADLCESVIAANATGLLPDTDCLHAPILRTTEIAEVLCTTEYGGILNKKGSIDVITCLRRVGEAGLGGGVFLVFDCQNDNAWNFIKEKGLLSNPNGTCGVIYRPYHLLGVEAPITILCAGLLNVSTGSLSYKPHVDLVVKATSKVKAGTVIKVGNEYFRDLCEPRIIPSAEVNKRNALPLYMANGNRVREDVPAETLLTYEMIEPPSTSRLWDLRRQQDKTFKII